jgi:transcriptional regulator with XRE-family HTH domain
MAAIAPLRFTSQVIANRLKQSFGAIVHRKRRVAQMTQEELSHAAGLSTTYISLVENGHKAPTILVLRQLANVLGVYWDSCT